MLFRKVFKSIELDDEAMLYRQRSQITYWMQQSRAYWRLEEEDGYNMDDWALANYLELRIQKFHLNRKLAYIDNILDEMRGYVKNEKRN